MTTFDKREDQFEKAFVHDAEIQFKIDSKRNRLVGLWAAEKLGLNQANSAAYADELVAAEASADADAKIFAKLRADFDAAGITLSDHQIQREIDERGVEARKAVKGA